MPKVSVIVVVYNSRRFLPLVFASIFAQTHKDLEVFAVINASTDGSKEYLMENFSQVSLIDPGKNIGFAAGNNLGIKKSSGELIQLVNPDLILEPTYVEEMVKAFEDPQTAAATGKLLRFDFENNLKTKIIDSTGITMSKSGRAKDRGQLEIDHGQYDKLNDVFGVSGAGPMYRRSAVEKIKYCENGNCEYFDEDFGSYWEDVDLSWRLNQAGFKNMFNPKAIAFHGRTAGQSQGGYMHAFHYIIHHSKLNPNIRRLNYKNHILMYLKNSSFIHPLFILREIAMFGYILVFETSTLKVFPELLKLIPKIWKKRRAPVQSAKL